MDPRRNSIRIDVAVFPVLIVYSRVLRNHLAFLDGRYNTAERQFLTLLPKTDAIFAKERYRNITTITYL